MKKTLQALLVALLLAPSAGVAQDYDKGLAAWVAGEYAAALREWRPLAEQGDATAQFNLGGMYELGEGVLQDNAEAVKWYRLAAEQGDARAQSNLGGMYANGEGVLQDNQLAHMWFNIGSANGHDVGGDNRESIAARMTTAGIEEAQERARVCMASNYQDCD